MFHTTSPLRQETHLSLVFEHIEQDLSVYLENCPQPGLPEWKIKVCSVKVHNDLNHMQIKTFHSLVKTIDKGMFMLQGTLLDVNWAINTLTVRIDILSSA